MSGIAAIGSISELSPDQKDEERVRTEPVNQEQAVEALPPVVKAADQQQAEKTTIQSFQYTGKGSFIDSVF